jgi:uncharacterized SAM-binding protein YcdF (DUF218 family)
MAKLKFYLLAVVGIVFIFAGYFAWQIVSYAGTSDGGSADAALVLGAAVAGSSPTPVFEERLRHAVDLYASGRVRYLVLTGGFGPGDALAESQAGRDWAVAHGVPAEKILIETQSHTTKQNFVYAKPLLEQAAIGRVLVVSDPLHMRRAMWMARALKIDAAPSPTPTSRYQTVVTQTSMLFREIWFSFMWWFRNE